MQNTYLCKKKGINVNLKTIHFEIEILYYIQAIQGCPYSKICNSKAEETNKKEPFEGKYKRGNYQYTYVIMRLGYLHDIVKKFWTMDICFLTEDL